MDNFWLSLHPRQLKQLETMPYPGPKGIQKRFRQKIRRPSRTVTRVLAACAAAAVLSIGVWAGYTRWRMPEEPQTYPGNNIQVHGENTLDPAQASTAGQETTPLTDQWFLTQAITVMEQIGKGNLSQTPATVTRQTNQSWSREEVVVSFSAGETPRDVTFDGETGHLIGVTAFDTFRDGGTPMDEADALAIAQGYYDALPYAEGYVFHRVEKFDGESWMYCFDRPIDVTLWGQKQTLYSAYEEVRIIIDPCTGAFQDSHCFYVPLLDDHQPGDEPLAEDQAREIAGSYTGFRQPLDSYQVTAELTICLPRPGWDRETGAEKYYGITRLAWVFTYTGEIDGFADAYRIGVDLYTGEILSVDVAK